MLVVVVVVLAPVPVPSPIGNPISLSVSAARAAALFSSITKFGICVVVAAVMVVAAVAAAAAAPAPPADVEDIVSPARLMLLMTFAQSVGWLLSTNSRCARARPASRPWQMLEMSSQIR